MNQTRGGSRAAAISKVELLVIIVNGFQPLTIITKSATLDVAAVLDPPLQTSTYCLEIKKGVKHKINTTLR